MSVKPLYNEPELLARMGRRDERAFRVLYDAHRRKVYTFSLRLLASTELAEEVLQEVFIRLWGLGEAAAGIGSVEAWLRTTTRNIGLNVLRRREVEARADAYLGRSWQEGHNDTEDLILLNDVRKLLKEGIAGLPPQQKRVYELCREQGLGEEEVAEQMGISPLTVRSHLQRAVRALQDYLRRHPDVAIILILFGYVA